MAEKLTLDVDSLEVSSFDLEAAPEPRGTVQAQSLTDVTQVNTGACCTAAAVGCFRTLYRTCTC